MELPKSEKPLILFGEWHLHYFILTPLILLPTSKRGMEKKKKKACCCFNFGLKVVIEVMEVGLIIEMVSENLIIKTCFW